MKVLFSTLLIATVSISAGQTPDSMGPKGDKPPLPNPILQRAPVLSQWTISSSVPASSPNSSRQSAQNGRSQNSDKNSDKPSFTQISITKSGSTYFEVEVDASGRKWEKWNVNGRQVTFEPGTGKSMVVYSGGGSFFYTDFSTTDFPNLSWISPENYIAFRQVGKVKCYIFRKEIAPTEDDGKIVILTAAVDSETQLPIVMDTDGQRSIYQFGPPPAAPLVIPEKVLSLLEQQPKGQLPRRLRTVTARN